jgi:molecular chaperone Hsp33
MVSGEVGEDIAHYLHQSHQIRSLVSLGVYLDVYGRVRAAGGLIVEVMPGVEEEIVEKIQKNAENVKEQISKLLMDGKSANDLVAPYLTGIPYTELDHDYPISYFCPCTKQRVLNAIEIMGIPELEDMIQKNEPADVTCQICGRPYMISVEELGEVRAKLLRAKMH